MSGQFSSLKILVADDNANVRSLVAAVLAGLDIIHVHECRDGAQALDFVKREPVDIAIVDFHMEPVDGVQFTKLIRKGPDSPNPMLPIIMLTGSGEKTRVFEARDAGVTEFIVKPMTTRALYDRINAVVFRPRPFVRSAIYFGPCRRRRQDPAFTGPFRRSADAQARKVTR